MNSEEHYISKIERNINALSDAPEKFKSKCTDNIIWASNIVSFLEQLDSNQRECAIKNIHEVLDHDYVLMNFDLEEKEREIYAR